MESKALESTPGQIEIVCKGFPNQREKWLKPSSDSGHWKRSGRCWIQWIGWSFQEDQCPILSVKPISRKKKNFFSNVALFWWRMEEDCQLVFMRRQRLGYRYYKWVKWPSSSGISSGSNKQWYKSSTLCVLCSWDSSSLFQAHGEWNPNSQPAEKSWISNSFSLWMKDIENTKCLPLARHLSKSEVSLDY